MKKIIYLWFVSALLIVLSPFSIAPHSGINCEVFIFPASLETVGDEAFAGTAIRTIIFQNKMIRIGNGAFQDTAQLKHVYIPNSIGFIGDFAFPLYAEIVIHGTQDGYAQQWAKDNGFDFIVDDIWTASQASEYVHLKPLLSLFLISCIYDNKLSYSFLGRIKRYIKSMRPQDRPELYPINYRFP